LSWLFARPWIHPNLCAAERREFELRGPFAKRPDENFREEFLETWQSFTDYYKKFPRKQLAEIAIDVINKSK